MNHCNTEDPEKILYHFWNLDEYGSLLHVDTGKDADTGMLNFDFMLHNGSPETGSFQGMCKNPFYKK
jgi:hypothetical protein